MLFKRCRVVAAPMLVSTLLAMPAAAATITIVDPPLRGSAIPLDPADFTALSSTPGSGESVVGDGRTVVLKNDPDAPHAFGRFDPFGDGATWIDSQDLERVRWRFDPGFAFTSLTFALFDAFDQLPSPSLGGSFFTLTVDDAEWSILTREPNRTLHWLEVAFDAPVETADLLFETRLNDGWGVSLASVTVDDSTEPPAPIPLPATAPLAALALAGLGALGLRRRRG